MTAAIYNEHFGFHERLLQIIMVGQPELRATLRLPELRQLAQRVI